MENVSVKKQYIVDGHGSVTALAESRVSEDGAVVSGITNTYVYDAYGNLLKQTGTTENNYLYANLVMYTDPSGYFLLAETGVAQDAGSFVEAVKGGEPEEIIFETLRLVISLFMLRSQCFVENILVSIVEGEKQIDEIEIGDYVWSYDTKTDNKVATEVTNILVSKTDVLVYVILSDGKEIKTTLCHPFYVKNGETGEWKAAYLFCREWSSCA